MATSRLRITTGSAIGARIELDDTDISMKVTAITVEMGEHKVHTASIEYVCDKVEIDGEFHITHRCGL